MRGSKTTMLALVVLAISGAAAAKDQCRFDGTRWAKAVQNVEIQLEALAVDDRVYRIAPIHLEEMQSGRLGFQVGAKCVLMVLEAVRGKPDFIIHGSRYEIHLDPQTLKAEVGKWHRSGS